MALACLYYTFDSNEGFSDLLEDRASYAFGLYLGSLLLIPAGAVVGFIIWGIACKVHEKKFLFAKFWLAGVVSVVVLFSLTRFHLNERITKKNVSQISSFR